jgi:RHS repeat-associated protein
LTDARGKTTTWTYDDMDRVETRTDPLTRQESFTYDLDGLLTSSTDRKAQVTTVTHDALHRRTFTGFDTTGTPASYASTITTTYDAGDRATEIVDSGAGTITRTYDLSDRLIEEETPEGTIDYTYDEVGRRATMQVDGQTAVSYDYDNASRLTGVTQGTAAVTLAYDNANRRTSLTLPNGVVTEYTYDNASQLTGLTYKLAGTPFGALGYAYDANGQRTAVTGSYARSGLSAALTSATYDDANQIATFGGTTFAYDDNGNLTSDGAKSYSWNARNELTGISGGVSASFSYDGVARRRSKTVTFTTTQFLYDGLNPVQELASGTPTANLLTGLAIDEYFTRVDSTTTRHYLTDALGSSVGLTDGSGSIQTEYTYEPFGGLTASGASSGNSFGFTGRESDGVGLQFSRARFYGPRTQRFLSEDPIGVRSGTINLYSYAANSPVDNSDPLGLWILGFGGTITGGAGVAGTGSFGVYVTSSGDLGVAFTGGVLGEAGGGASGTIGFNWYNGTHLSDLNGPFVNVGGSGRVPLIGPELALDFNIGRNSSGQVIKGGSLQGGFSAGSFLPGEGHGGVTFTKTFGCNIFSILDCLPSMSGRKH